jgi:hypothetical protein
MVGAGALFFSDPLIDAKLWLQRSDVVISYDV